MSKAKTIPLRDALLRCGDYVGERSYAEQIKELELSAAKATEYLEQADREQAFYIGMTDTLERTRRNLAALTTLLSMARDAADYTRNGIYAMLKAQDEYTGDARERQKRALERELQAQARAKANARYYEKKKQTN